MPAEAAGRSPRRWALAVAAGGALLRLGLWLAYRPVYYGDSGAYLRLAEVLSRLSLVGYDGTRVPAYPAFIALVGQDGDAIWIGQMVLGWLISLLLFWITWRTTGEPALGAAVGLLYDLIPGQILFEANLLTETLTAFWLVLTFALLLALARSGGGVVTVVLALSLGVAAGLAGLTRVLFFILPIWLLPFVWLAAAPPGAAWRRRISRLALYCAGPALLLGGWLLYIAVTYHMLAPTVMTGFNWVQHAGSYFEYLPDEEAAIRDTYLRYRQVRLDERGDQTNTIWEAIPALTEASGLSFFDLSRELQRLSWELIRQHPDLYLRDVVEGWLAFWKAPPYWNPDLIRLPGLVPVLKGGVTAGRGLTLGANALFLVFSAAALTRRFRHAANWDWFAWAVAGGIWSASIVQTLVDHGDNERFLVPLQMLVIYLVARSIFFWLRRPQAPG